MKAWHWQADRGGCGFYRMVLPARALRGRGHDARSGVLFDADNYSDADVIVGQRIPHPRPTALWAIWRHHGQRLVYDVDDDMWCMDDTNPTAPEYAPAGARLRMAGNAVVADVVTCATPVLAERIAGRGAWDVRVVRNGLPAGVLQWPRLRRDRWVIGWAGSASTIHDLAIVAPALRRLVDRWDDVEVHCIGCPEHAVRDVLGRLPRLRVTPWIAGTMAYLREVDFDVWVAPYRDTAFNVAKVGTKALEAAFLGIPVVATALPGYRDLVAHGSSGLLVDDPDDWTEAVLACAEDRDRVAGMGDYARAKVAPMHTIEEIAAEWETVLSGV